MSHPCDFRARPWAVIPAKSLREGKTRLAPILDGAAREHLNREFLTRTVHIARQLEELEGVVVVSPDEAARTLARELGAVALAEGEPAGLNQALARAAAWVAARGATHVMTISTDLPWLSSGDLRALLERALAAPGPSVTIAPDQAGQGTNVMVVTPAGVITYAYGRDSFERHRASARAAGARLACVRRPPLLFDIDSPEDLRRWRARHGPEPVVTA